MGCLKTVTICSELPISTRLKGQWSLCMDMLLLLLQHTNIHCRIWDALCKANDYLTIPGKDKLVALMII